MKTDISGFPELLPSEQIVFEEMRSKIEYGFRSYGFSPMDTPAVERLSSLLSKGNDNEIYGIYRLSDPDGKKEFGLRFDLTVPMVRYISKFDGELIFPFKRYQIAPVWRGERPQYGRYRQFYQCDIDVVTVGQLSIFYDAEIIAAITNTLRLLNVSDFHTCVNNRKILAGFLKTVISEPKINDAIRIVDKIGKLPEEEFERQIRELNVSNEGFRRISDFLSTKRRGTNTEILKWLSSLNFNEEFAKGVEELDEILETLNKIGIGNDYVKISTQLARGLTYYTGTVFETIFDNDVESSSIAGGGRYENLKVLSKAYTGIGGSIGLTRLISKLIDNGRIKRDKSSPAQILITSQDPKYLQNYMLMAQKFRKAGLNVDTYLQTKNLGIQLTYASRKGIRYVLIANEMELLEEKAILRNLDTKKQNIISTKHITDDVIKLILED